MDAGRSIRHDPALGSASRWRAPRHIYLPGWRTDYHNPGQCLEKRAVHSRRISGWSARRARGFIRRGQSRWGEWLATVLVGYSATHSTIGHYNGNVLYRVATGELRLDLWFDQRRAGRGDGGAGLTHFPRGHYL